MKLCSTHLSSSLPISPSIKHGILMSVYLLLLLMLLFYFSLMYNLHLVKFTSFKFPAEEIFTYFWVVNTEIDIQHISSTPEGSLCLLPLNTSPNVATTLIYITSFSCSELHKNGIKERIFFMCGSYHTTLCLWDSFMRCHFVIVLHFFLCSTL